MSENKGIFHAFSLEEGNFLVPKVRVFGIKGPIFCHKLSAKKGLF